MSFENQDYKLEVLEYAINESIDRLLPNISEDALSIILYQTNEVVWRVVTEIYTKSGHQIDFVFIRDILNLRVEPLRRKIAEEKRIRLEQEAKRTKIRAEEERIRQEQEAEQARIREEQEKIRQEREAIIQAELEAQWLAEKAKEEEEFYQFKEKYPDEKYPDININNYKEFDIFIRIRNIIIEELELEEEQVKLDSFFGNLISESYNNNNGRYYHSDFIDSEDIDKATLIMAIEEEFDMEIPDEECDDLLSLNVGQLVNLVMQKFD
jgi:acyl carrier protein